MTSVAPTPADRAAGVPAHRGHRRTRARSRTRDYLILIVLALLTFFLFLGTRDIVSSHEARVAQVARQMAASGWPWNATPVEVPAVEVVEIEGRTETRARSDGSTWRVNPWLIPVINGQVRLQKPPLPYWTTAVLFRFFGNHFDLEALARFPCALMGALATLIIYDLARRLYGNLTGWSAALVWLSSYFIPDEYRKVMADPYLAFFTLTAVWAWVRAADVKHDDTKLKRDDVKRDRALPVTFHVSRFILLFYLSLALGILAKGVIFPHIVIALASYHVCFRRGRIPGSILYHILGLILLALIALPWFIYVINHIPDAWRVMRYESIGELADNVEKARPWYFYFPQLLQIALPWTPALLLSFFTTIARTTRNDRRPLFPLLWYGLTVLFFSFVNLKKNAYLLPMMPAQTLLIAQGLTVLFATMRCPQRRGPTAIFLMQQRGLVFACALITAILCWTGKSPHLIPALIVTALSIAALHFSSGRYLPRPRTWVASVSISSILLLLAFFNFYLTPRDNLRSARPVAAELAPLLADTSITLRRENLPEEASLYLPLLRDNPSATRTLVIIDDRRNQSASDASLKSARRLHLKSAPGERARWKVFELPPP